MEKQCSHCLESKPVSQFAKRARASDGLQSWCKACTGQCAKKYYRTSAARREAVTLRNQTTIAENRRRVWEILKASHCVDCGEGETILLEFDHIDPTQKKYTVSQMWRNRCSWETVSAEIAKCQVRCANCHRRRTAKQCGYYKGLK